MNDKLKYGLIGLLIGAAGVWFFTANVQSGTSNMMSANTTSSDTLDVHFIEQMIPHHEDAITLAKLAQTKAQHPEVKELANNIIESQDKEIDQMKDWYKEWFGRDLPTGDQAMQHHAAGSNTGLHMGMTGSTEDITNLENSEDFDRAFVEHMIPHHQMAVMMASMLKDGTQRPEMKELADDIIVAQTNEIEHMRKWLSEWSN